MKETTNESPVTVTTILPSGLAERIERLHGENYPRPFNLAIVVRDVVVKAIREQEANEEYLQYLKSRWGKKD